jgi:hypothetical protein
MADFIGSGVSYFTASVEAKTERLFGTVFVRRGGYRRPKLAQSSGTVPWLVIVKGPKSASSEKL